jgi:hypothetical protein
MRSRLTPFLAAAALAASCDAASAYSGALLRSATLYAAPSSSSPVVATLPANAQIDVGPCRAYCLVSYGDVEGYVASSAILAEGSAPYQPEYRIGIFGLVF